MELQVPNPFVIYTRIFNKSRLAVRVYYRQHRRQRAHESHVTTEQFFSKQSRPYAHVMRQHTELHACLSRVDQREKDDGEEYREQLTKSLTMTKLVRRKDLSSFSLTICFNVCVTSTSRSSEGSSLWT